MTERILVTGAAGYVGSHVVHDLLRKGHRVRAAVRGQGRANEVRDTVAAAGLDAAGLEVVVADLTADGGWGEAMAMVSHVLHIASPFPAAVPQHDDDVIAPARDGTLRVLRHARDAGCARVVVTSSFAAVGYSPKPAGHVWTEDDWTDPSDDNTAYIRSKAIAERAAWDFVADQSGPELTALVPTGIFGPTLGPHLSTSVKFVQSMLAGELKRLAPQHFGVVDVRDVAAAHVDAMLSPRTAGQRILLVADGAPQSFLSIARILRDGLGDAAALVTTDELSDDDVRRLAPTTPALREALTQLGRRPRISNAKAKALLGWTPRPVTETILDTARSLG